MNGVSTISGNHVSGATAIGGGVLNNVGTIVMNDGSSIANNVAGPSSFANLSLGGGIYFVNGGSLTLNGAASITSNSAVDTGGGIYRIDGGFGSFTGITATNVTGNSPNNCANNGFAPAVPGCVGWASDLTHANDPALSQGGVGICPLQTSLLSS